MNGGTGLLLLRHGESTWNAQGLWQGWADPPLTDSGIRDIHALTEHLRSFGFAAVCCSDLTRARMTAEILAAGLGLAPPVVDQRLRERHVGEWSGLTDAEIAARWPGQLAAWRECDDGAPMAGGEDGPTVVARMRAGLLELWSRHGFANILVVSHANAIRLLDRALGEPGTRLANLAGRWLHWDGTSLCCGDVFDLALSEPGG